MSRDKKAEESVAALTDHDKSEMLDAILTVLSGGGRVEVCLVKGVVTVLEIQRKRTF